MHTHCTRTHTVQGTVVARSAFLIINYLAWYAKSRDVERDPPQCSAGAWQAHGWNWQAG